MLGVYGVRLTAEEDSGPSVIAVGGNNLWYQAGKWIRGGGWPVTFTASDPSGVCGTHMVIDGQASGFDNYADFAPDTSRFTQCPASEEPSGTLDTSAYPNGSLAIEYTASNAAGVASSPAETLQLDNTPVSQSLTTPNDSDPNVWVNHAGRVVASASGGPSGVGTSCSTNNGAAYSYPSGGITVDGTGVWTVACTSSNNAYDVNGNVASSPTQSVSVHIDETPPAVAFEPTNPDDPQAVVADTSDGQSGVSGGQVAMRPANGTTWQNLPTSFDGSHLLARFDDSQLAAGPWVIQATSCDAAGNCASTDETVTLPVRLGAVSSVSFAHIANPLKAHKIRKRVRVGWHWKTVRRHHHKVRVKAGGHFKTITIIKYRPQCREKRVKVGRHRWREKRVCKRPRLVLKHKQRVGYGRRATIHGLLTSSEGIPLGGQPVTILASPSNGSGAIRRVAVVTSKSDGTWSLRLRPGPSRVITGYYAGTPTIRPSAGTVRVIVPAKVKLLSVSPHRVPWGGTIRIVGQLKGGYLPPGGALVRLRIGSGKAFTTFGVQEHITGKGRFSTTYTFGAGDPAAVESFWIQVASLPLGNYPYAPADSGRVSVIVGGHPAPPKPRTHHHKTQAQEAEGQTAMMNRRGMIRAHSHWRPSQPPAANREAVTETATVDEPSPVEEFPADEQLVDEAAVRRARARSCSSSPRRGPGAGRSPSCCWRSRSVPTRSAGSRARRRRRRARRAPGFTPT